MPPFAPATAPVTPSDPLALWPAVQESVSSTPSFQSALAFASRNAEKIFVVPDLSLRCTGTMVVLGRLTPLLRALIAGSSHLVMVPEKIFATVDASRVSLSTPSRL